VDSVTLSVIWGGLVSATEEAAHTLQHTAYSEAVREGRDFSTGVFDLRGRLLAQVDIGPGHLGSMPFAVQHMLRYYPVETLEPGDAVYMNDLYMGSGHLPDVFCMVPVFFEGRPVGFAVTCCHHVDVGGSAPGSQTVEGIVDHFQEGLRLLPVRVYRRGQPSAEVLRLIEGNVRLPHEVLGDLRAQRLGCLEAERRLLRLFGLYGEATMRAGVEVILDRSEQAVREVIGRIPPGRYEAEDLVDDCGRGSDPIRLKVAVSVEGTDLVFDFTGTDPQTASGLNSPLNFTRSYCYWVTKAITTQHHIPQNEGQMRPVRLVAPEGSFVNPRPPAGAGARALLNHRLSEVLLRALAPAVPHLVTAANSSYANPTIGGVDARSGAPFIFYDVVVGGLGAFRDGDGAEVTGPVFSVELLPAEVSEAMHPVRVERWELIADSAGPGTHRGGCGVRKDIRVLADGRFNNLADRHRFPPWGLFGGRPGQPGATILNPDTPGETALHSKGSYPVRAGDVVSFRVAGAGGYGDPGGRDPEAVRRDAADGLVSREAAERDYGVRLDPATGAVDPEATRRLRGDRADGANSAVGTDRADRAHGVLRADGAERADRADRRAGAGPEG
jgi:N-methylhydantoinase B